MVPDRKRMRPFDSTDIDERTCILQNYGLSQRSSCEDVELGEPPIMFYDYALGEYQKLDENEEQIVEKKEDLWAALPLAKGKFSGIFYPQPTLCEKRHSLDHEYFPERPCELEKALFLRVIDFPELEYCWTEGFLKAMRAQMKPEPHHSPLGLGEIKAHNSPSDQREKEREQYLMKTLAELIPQAPIPAGPDMFKSGVSFSALTGREFMDKTASKEPPGSGSTDNAFLALMVYMPYFDISTIPGRKTESLTLAEYRFLDRGELVQNSPSGDCNKDLLVHQAWFMMLNNETIAMFRSAEDKHSDPAMTKKRPQPLLPDQQRVGAFHALVQMISNIFTSSRKRSLNFFRKKVAKAESNTRHCMPETNGNAVAQTLDSLVIDLITLKIIVQSQVEILEDLQDIYENTIRTPAQGNCYNRNVAKIPVLQKAKEEIPLVVVTIEAVVRERKKYQEKLDVLLERARGSKKYLSRILKVEALRHVFDIQTRILEATTSQTAELSKAMIFQTAELSKATDSQTEKLSKATDSQTEKLSKVTGSQTTKLIEATDSQTEKLSKATDSQTEKLSEVADSQTEKLSKATTLQTTKLIEATDSQTEKLSEVADSQTEKLSEVADSQTEKLSKVTAEAGSEQADANKSATEAQTMELEKQRQIVTSFTVLTTVFLPLGFCTSYAGAMSTSDGGYLDSPARHKEFWLWGGITTVAVLVITVMYVGYSRVRAKRIEKKLEKKRLQEKHDKDRKKGGGDMIDIASGGHFIILRPQASPGAYLPPPPQNTLPPGS